MICFTKAISASDVAAVGAIAKGPDAGRASGLKKAWVSNTAPRRPTLAWAKAERPAPFLEGVGGRFCGSGAVVGAGVTVAAACFATGMAGRGRGSGTFCAAADAASADSAHAAVNVK